jgi:hypothetical protein
MYLTCEMNPTTAEINHGEIEQLAYSIWEQEGRPDGRSFENWSTAENQLRDQVQNSARINERSSVVPPAEASLGKNTGGLQSKVKGNMRGKEDEPSPMRQSHEPPGTIKS